MLVRAERADDVAAIRAVVVDAFGRPGEARLVEALREAGDLAVSLVAWRDERVIGHVALSRLKSPDRALALAPVSVLTPAQGGGVGSRLIAGALERARRAGFGIVFVLGEPGYYARFGFSAGVAAPFPSPYAGPYFMARWLGDAGGASGPVQYADAFDDLA